MFVAFLDRSANDFRLVETPQDECFEEVKLDRVKSANAGEPHGDSQLTRSIGDMVLNERPPWSGFT